MQKTITDHFLSTYHLKPSIYRAPARINLIGEHLDYNDGFVMPAAVDRALFFAIAINQSAKFQLSAVELNESAKIDPSLLTAPDATWAKYFHAVLKVLKNRGLQAAPVSCSFGGNIPIGSGMSSSAALTCGFAFALNDLFDWRLSRLDLAKVGQAAEHLVGIQCGIMDQYAVLFGKKNQVLQLDCKNLTHEYFPLELREYKLVLINTMVSHSLADSAYNDRRKSCELVGHILKRKKNVDSFRDINKTDLESLKAIIPDIPYQRVQYVMDENERVEQTTKALLRNELEEVGKHLYGSHQGLSEVYEVSCEELDYLVDLVKGKPGVLGARMMGGGFGGCTINLIHQDEIERIQKMVAAAYFKKYKLQPMFTVVVTADGVSKL